MTRYGLQRTAIYSGRHQDEDGSGNIVNVFEESGEYGIGFGPADFRGAWNDPVGYTAQSIKDFLENDFKGPGGHLYPVAWDGTNAKTPESLRTVLDREIANPTQVFEIPESEWTNLPQSMDYVPGFDESDYKAWMLRAHDEHPGNTQVLRDLRRDVIDYVDNNNIDITPEFRRNLSIYRTEPFVNAGVWNDSQGQITNQMTSFFGAYEATPEGKAEQERRFNMIDVLSMQAAGFDDFDIYQYMKKNDSRLRKYEDGSWGDYIPGSVISFDMLRDNLIARGNAVMASVNVTDAHVQLHNDNRYHAIMKHPFIREIGEEMNRRGITTLGGKRSADMVDYTDFTALTNYIEWEDRMGGKTRPTGEVPYMGSLFQIRTQEQADAVMGRIARPGVEAGGAIGSGDYWKQWGAAGPQLDISDEGVASRGLSDLQQMVAAAGLYSDDPSTYAATLENIENRFFNELYGTAGKWSTDADDTWGLDIKRVGLDFDDIEWTDDETINASWYNTLTRGSIDLAFYQESSVYQEARRNLGLSGTSFGNVAEIRAANAWVHGQAAAIIPEDGESSVPPIVDWVPYTPRFNAEDAEPWTPKNLEITNYIPEERRQVTTDITQITTPTINVISNTFRVPTNLENWPHVTPTTPTEPIVTTGGEDNE